MVGSVDAMDDANDEKYFFLFVIRLINDRFACYEFYPVIFFSFSFSFLVCELIMNLTALNSKSERPFFSQNLSTLNSKLDRPFFLKFFKNFYYRRQSWHIQIFC